MRDFLSVFSYTFYENIRKKAFIISTVIILILTTLILNIPAVINLVKGSGKSENSASPNQVTEKAQKLGTIYILDDKGIITEDFDNLKKAFESYNLERISKDKINSTKELVKTGKNISLIVIENKDGLPFLNYYVKQAMKGLSPDYIKNTIKGLYSARLLNNAGVSGDISKKVLGDVGSNVEELGKGMLKSYISSILITMLMFFAVYFFGYGVAMSVASEKTSRIMEIMLTSTKPSRLILGKTAAMGFLGLLQFLSLIIVSFISYKLTFPKDFKISGQSINFSGFTAFSILMIFIYFILGYSLYALLNAVAGATVSKAEDLNSAMMPISLITVVSFYLAYGSFMMPDGAVSVAASIIPFSAAFSMPSRILATEVPAWQIIASLLALLAAIFLMSWISIKLYSRAVLHYGKRLKLNEIMKLSQ